MTESLKTQQKQLQILAEMGLDEAKRQGADACKIAIGTNFSKRLVVESGELSLASTLETRSVGVLVYKDQKKGSAYINTVSKDGLKNAISDALAIARFSVADPFLVMPGRDEAPKARGLPFLYEEALAQFSIEQLQGVMGETLAVLARDPRIALDRYEIALDVDWNGLVNSAGVTQEVQQAVAHWMFMGMAREGEQVTGMDYESYFSLTQKGLVALSQGQATLFAEKLLKSLNPVQGPTYKGVVVLSPRAVSDVLLDFIWYHMGGRQVMDQKSRWADRVGSAVLSPMVTIYDDPHQAFLRGATSFDGDGLPTHKQTLIKDGVLQRILHDCYSARKCGTKSTATAGGPFGCRIAGGQKTLEELILNLDQVLVVDRFSGSTDPVDGSFSGVAKSSRLYRHGQDCGPVIETMVSGNFFEIAQKIVGVSSETEVVSGSFESPYFLVDGVSVTGSASE